MGNGLKSFLYSILFSFALLTGANAQSCNDPSGFLKSFGPMNIGDLMSLGPDCQHLQGGSTGMIPATSVLYTWPIAGGVVQTQTQKNAQIVSVVDCGAKGDGVTDDAPAFRACYDGVGDGGAIYIPFPPGGVNYLMNSCRNNAVLETTTTNSNKAVSIYGNGWNFKTVGSYGSPRGSIIKLGAAIPGTCSFIRYAGTDVVSGITLKDFAVVASTGTFGTPVGLHGIFIDESVGASAFYLQKFNVDHVFIDNMAVGYSIKVASVNSGVFSGGLAFSSITRSQLMNFNADFLGDNINLSGNVFGQNTTNDARNVGIEISQVSGGTSTVITGNVFSNFNCMIILHGATKPVIRDNEFEQSVGFANTCGSMVDLRGDVSVIINPTVSGNSFSQNSSSASYIPIKVNNVANAFIVDNRIGEINAAGYAYITLTASSSAAFIGYNYCLFNTGAAPTVDLNCAISDSGGFTRQHKTYQQVWPGTTSGNITIQGCAVCGTSTLFWPVASAPTTDTVAILSNAQTFLLKTYDTASNSFLVSGQAVTGKTGTGGTLVFSTSPALTTPTVTGEAVFTSPSQSSTGALFTTVVSAGDYVPAARMTYAGVVNFEHLAFWMRSAGDAAFGSWALWSHANVRWEFPITSTYGSALQTFNDNLAGDVIFYSVPSAAQTAGNPVNFLKRVSFLGIGDIIVGNQTGALATNAATGYFWAPGGAGAPTGTPTATPTGTYPIYIDTTNKKICYRFGGTWECSAAFTP